MFPMAEHYIKSIKEMQKEGILSDKYANSVIRNIKAWDYDRKQSEIQEAIEPHLHREPSSDSISLTK